MMAFGIVRSGRSTSSVGKVESSNPAYAQNISTRALPKVATLPVKNGDMFSDTVVGFAVMKNRPPTTMRTRGLSLIRVSRSLVRPAALMLTKLVTRMMAMNAPFNATSPAGPMPGTNEVKY